MPTLFVQTIVSLAWAQVSMNVVRGNTIILQIFQCVRVQDTKGML